MASYFFNTIKDKASSSIQQFAEKMLIQPTAVADSQEEETLDDDTLGVIVEEEWGA